MSHQVNASWTLAMTPRETRQHFLGELVVMECRNWAGFSLHSWVSASPCTSQPHGWHCERGSARELSMICTRAALDAQNLQVGGAKSSQCPISWGSSGLTPQATASSMRLAVIHQLGSAGGGTLWNGVSSLVITITFSMVVVLAVQRFFWICSTWDTPIRMPFFVSKDFPSKGILLTNFCKAEENSWDYNLQLPLHGLLGSCQTVTSVNLWGCAKEKWEFWVTSLRKW